MLILQGVAERLDIILTVSNDRGRNWSPQSPVVRWVTGELLIFWITVWRFLKKLEIELPYDPAIPLLGIHTKETRS